MLDTGPLREQFGGLLLLAGEPEAVFAVEDRDAEGVPIRIFRPSPDPDLPVVVYFHGGGWTIGVSGLLSAAAMTLMAGLREPERARPAESGSVVRHAWQGLRYVVENPTLRGLALTLSVTNIGSAATTAGSTFSPESSQASPTSDPRKSGPVSATRAQRTSSRN